MRVTKALRDYLLGKTWIRAGDSDDKVREVVTQKMMAGELDAATVARLQDETAGVRSVIKDAVAEALNPAGTAGRTGGLWGRRGRAGTPTPREAFSGGGSGGAGGGGGTATVTLGRASEQYSAKRLPGVHAKTGQAITLQGAEVSQPSEADRALLGAWCKFLMRRAGLPATLTEHDQALLDELIMEGDWTDASGPEPVTIPGGERVKALLDDSVSGGIHLNPVLLDDALLVGLLLTGELLPFVDVRDVGRGRTIRTGLIGRPLATWGVPDGTAMPLFDTTGLVGAVDTTIHDLKGSVELGNDLVMDSPLDVGDYLLQGLQEDMTAKVETAIAVGDGVTRPLGVSLTSGLTAVASANGATGPVTVGDLEGLLFAVAKPYRARGLNPGFVMNEVTFRRFRTIPTGSAYNTRAFGMDYTTEYTLLGYPVRIAPDLPNGKALFVALRKYRLFRRLGVVSRVVTEGSDLALRNVSLLVAISRWGGRLIDPKAGAQATDLQS